MRNCHDIAIELEHNLSSLFGYDFSHSPTIFSADQIETHYFYNVMELILYCIGKHDCIEFINNYYELQNKKMNKIDNCEEIYNEFLKCLK